MGFTSLRDAIRHIETLNDTDIYIVQKEQDGLYFVLSNDPESADDGIVGHLHLDQLHVVLRYVNNSKVNATRFTMFASLYNNYKQSVHLKNHHRKRLFFDERCSCWL